MRSIEQILKSSGYPERAEYEWLEFEKTYRAVLGRDLPAIETVPALATLFGRSFYLVQRLLKDPNLADRFFHSDFIKQAKPLSRFQDELEAAVDPVRGDHDALLRVFRHYRYEETLRLTVRELSQLDSFTVLGQERSALAQACVNVAVAVMHEKLIKEYGPAIDEDGQDSTFVVLGMGKLGGEDLNYSSDIDLIYSYSSDEGHFKDMDRADGITHHEYFVRLSEMVTHCLSEKTADGFVYRVDTDLRPEGQKGTLANSVNAMEIYYESFGSNWERMAMTKARPVGGTYELAENFLKTIQPFVYPKLHDYSTLEQIRDLKNRIEQSLQQKLSGGIDAQRPGYNVKLGIGGIRELEFFVGAFQRLYGGQDEALRERRTLVALERLQQHGLITEIDQEVLGKAYVFLRQTENQLQTLDERQTHAVPKMRDERLALARNLLPSSESAESALDQFQEQLIHHTEHVRRHFERLLESQP